MTQPLAEERTAVYGALPVATLTDLLRARHLRLRGSKAELVQRLVRFDTNALLPEDYGRQSHGDADGPASPRTPSGTRTSARIAKLATPASTGRHRSASTSAAAPHAEALAKLKTSQAEELGRLSVLRQPGLTILYFLQFCANHASEWAFYLAERILTVAVVVGAAAFLAWLYQIESNRNVRAPSAEAGLPVGVWSADTTARVEMSTRIRRSSAPSRSRSFGTAAGSSWASCRRPALAPYAATAERMSA